MKHIEDHPVSCLFMAEVHNEDDAISEKKKKEDFADDVKLHYYYHHTIYSHVT